MKKEAINTFGEGMIMDLHPLTTPNNVLTNCLNGTIITYNGNEFVLQNDMGNGEVHTAHLDAGYIPVGMKEHGGIIYIAAHNPVTNKSQIGSFPSPQQLYEGDDLDVTPINFHFTNFIELRNGIPFIKRGYYKQKLFQKINTGEAKVFHPGDRFVIVSDVLNTTLRKAIANGIVRLRLGVVNSSGSIDYIDDESLKLYKNGLWIYENSTIPLVDVLKSNELIQVFSAKSSGVLILVIELKTFDTFNLIRKYSSLNDLITVTMIGETRGKYNGKTTTNDDIKLFHDNGLKDKVVIQEPQSSTKKVSYSVAPACPYGILERMEKKGTLDFDAIRSNKEVLGEWRFFVTNTYVKIGWGYDYYNMNEGENVEKIQFVFININRSSEARNVESLHGDYVYDINQEDFNGSFEEVIAFSDSTIKSDWVYLVRIDKYVQGKRSPIAYRILYTGMYFNDYFGNNPDFTQLRSSSIRLDVETKISTKINSVGIPRTFLKTTKTGGFVEKEVVNVADFITEVSSPNADITNYQYTTKRTAVYEMEITPSIEYKYDKKLYAGVPSNLTNFFNEGVSLEQPRFNEQNISYNSTSPIIANISSIDSKIVSTNPFKWNSTTRSFIGQVQTSRSMFANSGGIKSTTFSSEVLEPLYNNGMNPGEYDKLCSFKVLDDVLYCAGGSINYCSYNARIIGVPNTIGEYRGENAGAGIDEAGLQASLTSMGSGTVGIFAGTQKNDASLQYKATRRTVDNWSCSKNEVDGEDNFLLGTWKDVNGKHWIINLASQKTSPNSIDLNRDLVRLDIMLRCLLSQMCVVKRKGINMTFVGPNNLDFVYHTAFDTIFNGDVTVSQSGYTRKIFFYLGGDEYPVDWHVTDWKTAIDALPNAGGLADFLPTFTILKPRPIPIEVPFGDNLKLDTDSNLLSCYMNAYSSVSNKPTIDDNIDRGRIYIGIPTGPANSDGSLNLIRDSRNRVKVRDTDDKIVDWRNREVTLNYSLNDRFITAYKQNSMSDPIKEGFYNEVYIQNIQTVLGTWTNDGIGHGKHAPDMALNVSFGRLSLYH